MRILVTGSRDWRDGNAIGKAIAAHLPISPHPDPVGLPGVDWDQHTVVHGAARGADTAADRTARAWDMRVEPYPAADFPDPKTRNLHMVSLGADVCLTFATRWASGTGHCARAARRAGIRTIDYGVSTRLEDRP